MLEFTLGVKPSGIEIKKIKDKLNNQDKNMKIVFRYLNINGIQMPLEMICRKNKLNYNAIFMHCARLRPVCRLLKTITTTYGV